MTRYEQSSKTSGLYWAIDIRDNQDTTMAVVMTHPKVDMDTVYLMGERIKNAINAFDYNVSMVGI